MDRSNHYERAFAAYLRERGSATIAIDETRRTVMDDEPLKNADFIVVGPGPARLVVDVKGRRFPGGTSDRPRAVWQNWSTESDVIGLRKWADGFGESFRGVFAFIYEIAKPFSVHPNAPDHFQFEKKSYLIRGIDALAYAATMKQRSKRWGTVYLPATAFRALCRPFSFFFQSQD
jgi:hypothetical protein